MLPRVGPKIVEFGALGLPELPSQHGDMHAAGGLGQVARLRGSFMSSKASGTIRKSNVTINIQGEVCKDGGSAVDIINSPDP